MWAVAMVRSRAHAPLEADKIALVPLADSIPHSRRGNTSWKLKAAGLFSRAQVSPQPAALTVLMSARTYDVPGCLAALSPGRSVDIQRLSTCPGACTPAAISLAS
jgi:hypothetical protein